jgi:CRP-like cAMP-binding protein
MSPAADPRRSADNALEDTWLSSRDMADLRAIGSRRRLPAGATLFVEGDQPFDVDLVESGEIKLTTLALSGQELVLDVAGPGAILGELSAIDGAPRSATALALTNAEVTAIAADRFLAFLADRPEATRGLLILTIRRLRLSNRRQLEYTATDALGRVCHRLDELAGRYGLGSDKGVRIELPLTQTELAQWCGLSREAVVKALRKLRDLGWVAASVDGTILICDRQEVRRRGFG